MILSGDHIYKMDYSEMVLFHQENHADCTIASIEVPWEEAPRFGILNTNADGTDYEFDEKPAHEIESGFHGHLCVHLGEAASIWSKDAADRRSAHDFEKTCFRL